MLNSAASALVGSQTNEMVKGEKDSKTITSQYQTSKAEDTENLKAQFATLKVRDDKKTLRPRNNEMAAATELTESKQTTETRKETGEIISAERSVNKRSLPSTPKSIYSSSTTQTQTDNRNSKRTSTASVSSSINTGYVPSSRNSNEDVNKSQPMAKQTHIGVYKFIARHEDEINLDNGDPVHVSKRCEDLWFEGINMRTGKSGIFPSRYVSAILREDFRDDSASDVQENQFSVRFLGSVEVFGFKGNEIICDAIKQIVKQHQLSSAAKPPACTLDVNARGIRIIEHAQTPSEKQGSVSNKRTSKRKIGKLFDKDSKGTSTTSHFFALKNVTFCGCHPNNARFFAFITKHPEDQRFACHVFMSEFSTEPVANAVGRAFNEFYAEFLDYQAPVEDFYIE